MASTNIPVMMRFLAETRDLEEGTKRVKDETEGSLEELQTIADQAGQIARDAVQQVYEAYDGLKVRMIQGIAAGVAAMSGATVVGLASIGKSSVDAASGFQDLQARIQGMTGDAEKAREIFAEGIEFTAKGPFGIEGVEEVVGTLEAFGVGGKQNLELVANIAASSGRDIEEFGVRVSKALTGSSQGFQALRDTAGITGERLARYGAVLSETGNVSLKTTAEIEAATRALKQFGQDELGGSIELLGQTYRGAMNNAENATKLLKATIGEAFLPTLTALIQGFAAGTNALAKFIEPFSGAIAVIGTLTAAAAGAVGVVAGLAIPFAGVIAKALLVAKAISLAQKAVVALGGSAALLAATQTRVLALAASTGTLSLRLGVVIASVNTFATALIARLVGSLQRARAAMAAVAASPVAPIFLAAAAAAGVATFAINRFSSAAEELGRNIEEAARRSVQASREFRDLVGFMGDLTGQEFSFGLDVATTAEQTAAALQRLSAVEFAAALRAQGKSLQDLEADLARNRKEAEELRPRLQALREAISAGRRGEDGTIDVFRLPDASRKVLQEAFGPEVNVSIAQAKDLLVSMEFDFTRLGQSAAIFRQSIEFLDQIPRHLEDASSQASSLANFLSFAGRLEGVGQLNDALGITNDRIADIERNLTVALGTVDRFELTRRLGDPNLDQDQEKVIKTYLGLLDSRAQIEQKVSAEVEKARKAEIDAYNLVTERRKVLGDLSLDQERERVQAKLALVQQQSSEEVAILKELASIDEEILRERVEVARELIGEQMEAVRDSLAEAKSSPDATNTEVAAELRQAIQNLKAFENANKEAFATSSDDAKRFQRELTSLTRELARVEAAVKVDQFRQLQSVLRDGIDSRGTTAQRIAQTAQAIGTLKQALQSGTVDQSSAEQYLLDLERQKLDLNRQQTDEKLKQANEVAALQQRALEEEIRVLELRQQAGENVDQALADSRKELLQVKLDAIEQERQAAIDADKDEVLSNRKAQLERDRVIREAAVQDFERSTRQQTSTGQVGASISGRNRPDFSQNRGSGAQFQQFSDSGILSSSSGGFSLPDFAEGFGVRRERPRPPSAPKFEDIRQRISDQVGVGSAKAGQITSGSASQVTNVNNNTTLLVEGGQKKTLAGNDEDQILAVVNRHQKKTEYYDPHAVGLT